MSVPKAGKAAHSHPAQQRGPVSHSLHKLSAEQRAAVEKAGGRVYIVGEPRHGHHENLWQIAKALNVTLAALRDANPALFTPERLNGDRIYPKDEVIIPPPTGGWTPGAGRADAPPVAPTSAPSSPEQLQSTANAISTFFDDFSKKAEHPETLQPGEAQFLLERAENAAQWVANNASAPEVKALQDRMPSLQQSAQKISDAFNLGPPAAEAQAPAPPPGEAQGAPPPAEAQAASPPPVEGQAAEAAAQPPAEQAPNLTFAATGKKWDYTNNFISRKNENEKRSSTVDVGTISANGKTQPGTRLSVTVQDNDLTPAERARATKFAELLHIAEPPQGKSAAFSGELVVADDGFKGRTAGDFAKAYATAFAALDGNPPPWLDARPSNKTNHTRKDQVAPPPTIAKRFEEAGFDWARAGTDGAGVSQAQVRSQYHEETGRSFDQDLAAFNAMNTLAAQVERDGQKPASQRADFLSMIGQLPSHEQRVALLGLNQFADSAFLKASFGGV